MRTWARQQRGESDESFAMRKRIRATNELRAILATPEGRQALKALLTEDGPTIRALSELGYFHDRVTQDPVDRDTMRSALAAAVDALDSPEGDA